MPPSNKVTQEEIDADLQRFELGMRQLKIEYDRYFAGGRKRQPVQLRFSVQKIIKRNIDLPMPKYSQRFQFNSLVSRYNILTEHWDRRVRKLEEGVAAPQRAGRSQRAEAKPASSSEELLACCRISGTPDADASIRDLHAAFVEARRASGEGKRDVSYDRFVKGISQQMDKLRQQSGCEEVELRIVVNSGGRVQLRARPTQETPAGA